MAFENTARTGFATAADYGWCETDRAKKDAKAIRVDKKTNQPIRQDYFRDFQNKDFTKYFFDVFGLPFPAKESVYHGNSQDMLFMPNHGLVVKTGPLDVIDLIHPGVIQPLYWMPHEVTGHVIAMYSGVQLLKQKKWVHESADRYQVQVKSCLEKTGQFALDIEFIENIGHINGVPIVVDTENNFFGTSPAGKITKQKKWDSYQIYTDAGCPPHIAIQQVMTELYDGTPEFRKWMPAFQYHQPLREQIHTALNENDVNKRHQLLGEFYQRCRNCVEGKDSEVALYRPWTGNPDDNKPKNGRNATFPHPA